MKHRLLLISLWTLFLLTVITRFYNLNWGAPYYFHPDERNIASSVVGLSFPGQMNPHFFAYGSLPIYAIYFLGVLLNTITHTKPTTVLSFSEAIVLSRVFSALFACLLPFLLYRIGKMLLDERTGLVAAFLGTVSVGLTQYAHFGTFEMWLTLETLFFFLCCASVWTQTTIKSVLLLGLISGCLIATKVSTLPLISIAFLSIIIGAKRLHTNWHLQKKLVLKQSFLFLLLFVVTMGAVYVITNPYVLLDTNAFLGSITYEKNVATGAMHVFYTDEFIQSVPGVYQLLHVFPFLLTPLLSIFWIPAFLYSLFVVEKKRRTYLLFVSIFLLTLIPQLGLYVKWTRYMVPTLPFIYIFIAIAFTGIFRQNRRPLTIHLWSFLSGVMCLSLISGWIGFTLTVYASPDTRVMAAQWAGTHLPHDAFITTEPYDLGLVPFNTMLTNMHIVDFYGLENTPLTDTINELEASSSAVILPSTRIERTRIAHPTLFPNGAMFYSQLMAGKLNFSLSYQTPCDAFCTIAYFGKPENWYEETSFVFDRPMVTILTKNDL